jgi:TRAP-type C4-dicarboxylate transport system substrate-binding protein
VLARLVRDGAQVARLTQTGKAPFREKTRSAYDKWARIVGEDLVRAAEATAR